MFDIDEFLKQAIATGASDIHIVEGGRPAIRVHGKIKRINFDPLTKDDMLDVQKRLVPLKYQDQLENLFDLDFSYEIPGISRFRVNLNHQLGKPGMVIRAIPYTIKSFKDLQLPELCENFATFNNGLVLITGPTGSGKSTTISSLIDYINQTQAKHIITCEDPCEFIYTNKKSVISQRQLGIDTTSFAAGLKYALRQDPDIIFIGEIRDKETINAALKAAETGPLVVSTLHTNDAVQSISRILNMFEPSEQVAIRSSLANALRGTIAQKLVPAKENGRFPAVEVLIVSSTVKDYILKDELDKIYLLAKNGASSGIITMNQSLYALYIEDKITKEMALDYSDNKTELEQMMRGIY